MSSVVNPYRAPAAALADAREQTQPVKLLSISGRIGRARYIAYSVALYLVFVMLIALLAAVNPVLSIVPWALMLMLMFMLSIQRSHDFNFNGWLSLLMLVPLVNFLFLLVPGTDGANRYGPRTPPNTTGVLILAWLLPVVMVLGIVAAVALPAYQNYLKG